jgi:hypothetical protein
MKAAKRYINTICKALKNWEEWTENGENILRKEKFLSFHFLISRETKKLRELDAQDVMDSILEHEDEIEFRLQRLDNYCLPQTIGWICKIQGTTAQLSDSCLNGEINAYRQLIEAKALDLIRVIDECEKYIIPQDPHVEKAIKNEHLLRYFKYKKKELISYIKYCKTAKNPTEMAQEIVRLWERNIIEYEHVNTDIYNELKLIFGEGVGKPNNWKTATYTEYKKRH